MTPRTWHIVREGLGVRLGLGLGPGGGRNGRTARAIFESLIFARVIGQRMPSHPQTALALNLAWTEA